MKKQVYAVEPNGEVKKFGSCQEAAEFYGVGLTTPSNSARRMARLDHRIYKRVNVRRYFFSYMQVIDYKERQGIK